MKCRRLSLLSGLCCVIVSGCNVGPNYQPPVVKVNSHFGDISGPTPPPTTQPASVLTSLPAPSGAWWAMFDDPELDRLIQRAMAGNLNLQAAESRLRQSRYQVIIAGADEYPQINADGGYNHARGSKNVKIPTSAFGVSSPSSPSASPAAKLGNLKAQPAQEVAGAEPNGPQSPLGQGGLPNTITDVYQIGFDSTWEIDIFGGTRRAIEAANDNAQAALEDRNDVLVSLQAEVARDYIALRGYQRQEAITLENLGTQRDTLALTRSKYENGFVTELDVARQAAEVANTSAEIPPLIASERQQIHQLGILLGEDPEALSQELTIAKPIPPVPPVVPAGLPGDLLRRRPDIRRAERQAASATAQIGVATADLFPKFTLTGLLGLDSSQPKNLFQYQSHYYEIVPGVTWPIFDAGRILANVHVQNEMQRQAVLNYEQTVLSALGEVEDSLASYRTEQLRRLALIDAVTASRQALELARQQYQQGVIDFLTVLDTQRSLLDAEDELAQSDQAVSDDLVELYKALGGGWEKSKS
ncbi:MAG TPA: efflux transporter outer membrane subunit [Tepidisphaeraceae bacterium]|nr:efflux transporter outer membrane subunit [Tepidisphaeraceae bacterium]